MLNAIELDCEETGQDAIKLEVRSPKVSYSAELYT